jgi:putative peptidoglycan lipid II flippase
VTQQQTSTRQIARAAGTVAFAIVFGQLLGLLRSVLVARAFPVSERDAFFAANRVAETLFTLVAAGALGSAFLPTFTGLLVKGDKASAWKLAASLANLVTLTLSLLAVIAGIFAPQIIRYALAPGLATDPALFALTVDLLRIQLLSAILFGLGGLVVGILNAHQIFLIPQLTAAMYQIGQIFGVLVLARWWGIYGLAWGVVIGAGLYVVIQIPTLLKLTPAKPGNTEYATRKTYSVSRIPFSAVFGLDNPAALQVIRLMGPRVLGAGVVQLNFWVNTALASQMAPGSVAAVTYGFALMLMAQAAIAQSVAIAVMPTFSAQFALGKVDEMRHALVYALRGMLLAAVPASVGLMILAGPIVSMLYQRGKFSALDAEMTAWALLWYAAGMIGHSMMEVLTRAFYAQQDTKTPVLIGALAMSLNVAFSFAFSAWFGQIGWLPLGGLALANSLATALEATALFVVMRKRLNGIEGKYLLDGVLRIGAATLGMAIALLVWMQAAGSLNRWLFALGGVAVGCLVYALGVVILKIPEIQAVVRAVRRRLHA